MTQQAQSIETKFTPGPWRTLDGDSVVNVLGADGQPVAATTTKTYYERFDATDRANARLIAAAPALHATLTELVRMCDLGGFDVAAVADAKAALQRVRAEV